jgi:hypothetical protein
MSLDITPPVCQAEGDPEVGDIVVVPSKYGEDQFEVTAITGGGVGGVEQNQTHKILRCVR